MPRAALLVFLLSIGGAAALQAQTTPPADAQPAQQQPSAQQPRDLMVAPSPAEKTPEATPSRPGNPGHGTASAGPANVCAELVAFFEKKAAEPAKPSDPAKAGQASQPAQSGTQTAGPGQTAPPMDRVQQRSGISAPVPQDDSKTGASQVTMERAQQLAQGNDLRGCQDAVDQMRRAGMALPAGLLALAALREDLLAKSQPPATQQSAPQNGQGAPAPPGPGSQ